MWKWAILGSPDPPKPLQGPPDPPGGAGRPKMAKINIIQSTGDNLGQQIIFGGSQFFSVFSLGMTQNQMGCLFPTLLHKSFVHSRLIDILLLSTLFGTNSFFTCIWYQIWSFIIPILFADPLAQVLCPFASDRCLEAEIEAEDWDAPLPRSYLSGSTKSPSWVTGVF